MIDLRTLVYAIALVLAYLIVANRLFKIGERFRKKSINTSLTLLNDAKVPLEIKEIVEDALPSATSAVVAWCFAIGVIPAALTGLMREMVGQPRPDWLPRPQDSYWQEWDDFGDYFIAASLCNSPIAAFLFVAQIVLLSFVVMPHVVIGRLIRSAALHNKRDGFLHGHKPA
jgi:hypothetical protein